MEGYVMNMKLLATVAMSATVVGAIAQEEETDRPERPDPEEIVVEVFTLYDANEDNALNATELGNALVGMHEARKARREARREELGLEPPEIPEREENPDRPTPADIAARIIENVDTNGDQLVDTEEFLTFLENRKGPRRGPGGKGGFKGPGRGARGIGAPGNDTEA